MDTLETVEKALVISGTRLRDVSKSMGIKSKDLVRELEHTEGQDGSLNSLTLAKIAEACGYSLSLIPKGSDPSGALIINASDHCQMIHTKEAIDAADIEHARIESLLHDGTKEQLDQLAGWRCPRCGSLFSYEYSPEYGGFSYGCKCTKARACKVFDPPACVEYFGNKHTFKELKE